MRKTSLYCTIAALALAAGLYSCKKVNGIDNDQVVQTPYSLFFADSAGTVYNSSDGITKKVIFRADGRPCRAICVGGTNIFIIKDQLYYSTNNGVNFNHSYDSVSQAKFAACGQSDTALPHNQTMVLDIPDSDWPRTYVATSDPHATVDRVAGAAMSWNTHGTPGSWFLDGVDTNGAVGYVPTVYFHSFTRLANGIVVGYDAVRNRVFYREKGTLWKESTGNDAGLPGVGAPARQTGNGLPQAAYCIGHFNNELFALINQCASHGAWYSDDTGRNWKSYPGLPANDLLCIAAPFEQTLLVGTRGAGLYIFNLNTHSFQQAINGLTNNMTVRSITAKQNIYKNGNVVKYIYLATDKGLFVSKDGGVNWSRTLDGNYTAIY